MRHLFLALAVVAAAGCSDPAPTANPAAEQAAANARAIEELRTSVESLRNEIRQQDRQLAGMGRELATSRSAAQPGAAPGNTGGESADPDAGGAAAADADPALDEETADAILRTESGRKAIEKAAARELAKREAQERRTFVSYTIGVFARDAGLDERQTRELQTIWKESLDSGGQLRQRFAALRDLPEDERKEARAKAMEVMREIGRNRNERVRALLSAEQYELYGKTEEEIVASLHGRPRSAPVAPKPE